MKQNIMKIFGTFLILLGLAGFIYGGIEDTARKRMIAAESLTVNVDQKTPMPLAPIGGAAAVAAGSVLMVVGWRRPPCGKTFCSLRTLFWGILPLLCLVLLDSGLLQFVLSLSSPAVKA